MRELTHFFNASAFAAVFFVFSNPLRAVAGAERTRMILGMAELFTLARHVVLELDYLSCILTILSTILIGRRLWQGWVVAGANSVIICIIGVRTAQFGFVPANLFCLGLYTYNLFSWRRS